MEVTIADSKITDVEILSAEKEDSAYLTMAKDIIPEIIDAQSADVDTISGSNVQLHRYQKCDGTGA